MNDRIADLALPDRPRERLAAQGAGALSAPELVAVVLGSGVRGKSAVSLARQLLEEAGGLAGLVATAFDTLRRRPGVGVAKAARLHACLELGRRLVAPAVEDRPAIRCPDDAAAILVPGMSALQQEHVWALLLDSRRRLLRVAELLRGGLDRAPVRAADVFRPAIAAHAASLILAHNHPSGDPTPSAGDVALTRRLLRAGHLLGVELADHLVVGGGRYVSLKATGRGFG